MSTVLVVDDDAGCRKLMAKILSLRGFRTICAGNGREALDVLGREPASLVLLDLMMPEMDGYAFLRELREKTEYRNLPVIVVSGVADLDCAGSLRKYGVEQFLVKARFTLNELEQQIRRYVGNQPPGIGETINCN